MIKNMEDKYKLKSKIIDIEEDFNLSDQRKIRSEAIRRGVSRRELIKDLINSTLAGISNEPIYAEGITIPRLFREPKQIQPARATNSGLGVKKREHGRDITITLHGR